MGKEGSRCMYTLCPTQHSMTPLMDISKAFQPPVSDALDVRRCVRLNFANLLLLAYANRPVRRIVAAGSVPSELQALWEKMEEKGVGGREMLST